MPYVTKIYKDEGGSRMTVADGGQLVFEKDTGIVNNNAVRNLRVRATTAQVNAGLELLPAIAGFKYRITDLTLIAIGGNAATATSVDIVATQGGSAVRPFVAAVAALTRSTVVKPNTANVTVLADGASFSSFDANTGMSVSKQAAGSNLATATNIDVILVYVIEAA